MKVADLRKKSPTELIKHAGKLKEKLAEAKRAPYLKDVKNVKESKNLRRELARTLTIAKEKVNAPGEKE